MIYKPRHTILWERESRGALTFLLRKNPIRYTGSSLSRGHQRVTIINLEIYVSAKEQDVRGTSSHSAKLRPEDVPKIRPMDVSIWSSMYRQGMSPADVLRRPLLTSFGRWNMTSWGRSSVTSWGHSHNVLYATLRDVPCQRLEDVFCRRYEDVPILSNLLIQGVCPTDVLRTPLRDVPRTSGRCPYMVL